MYKDPFEIGSKMKCSAKHFKGLRALHDLFHQSVSGPPRAMALCLSHYLSGGGEGSWHRVQTEPESPTNSGRWPIQRPCPVPESMLKGGGESLTGVILVE